MGEAELAINGIDQPNVRAFSRARYRNNVVPLILRTRFPVRRVSMPQVSIFIVHLNPELFTELYT